MISNRPGLLSTSDKLYHVSEEPRIAIFNPRPSPSELPGITGNVVFAVSGHLLHNYLLPRDCPRVTFYASPGISQEVKDHFFGKSKANFIITVESGWYQKIKDSTIYIYEFPNESFALIDENAGYYVSYQPVKPLSVHIVKDMMTTLLEKDVELRFTPSLTAIAESVKSSGLNYSLIRMRNATK